MEKKPVDVKTIFAEAAEIQAPEERAAYLDKACSGDAALRAEVERLLEAHEHAGDFLEGPRIAGNVTLDASHRIDGPGVTIGRYTLLELLGEGGMGLVYLAEQKQPVRRKVALKIIKPGMDSRQVIARFEAERQTLAVLDHPNIAHVFDAGCTDTGRPYFVMEYVKGLPITSYCDQNKLTIEQRLRLFEQVCEAVHHAHQKGIIHRDIKPSNILVSAHEDRATPKIIDFGIAKATTQSLTDATMFTCQGQFLGTPEYMSPEQADLATQDIDTRSDIYSLGVVLYELLAGVLPFESESFTKIGLAEIQRTIREIEPASPSVRLTQMGDKAKGIAESRGTQVVPLARRLHRELEWIPLKAMRKDRCRRYRSASEMADDIHNYLNGRPLIAGPETAIYRVQKFVHKHAGSVATVALVAVAVILGLVVSTAMYFRAEEARQKEAVARGEAEQATKKEAAARVDAEQAREAEQEQRSIADGQRRVAEDRAENLRQALYVNSIQLADARHREGDTRRARELLSACPEDLKGWEWERLNYTLDQSAMSITTNQDWVTSLALTRDGKRIVSGGWDKTIKVWDVTGGSDLVTINVGDKNEYFKTIYRGDLDAHRQTRLSLIFSVAFTPDGDQVVSGHWSGEINVWDSVTGQKLRTFKGHEGSVYSMAFSPDGKHMVSRGYEVKLWDTVNWAELMSLSDPNTDKPDWTGIMSCVAFSPDGRRIASAGGLDGQIQIWDATTGQRTPTRGHKYSSYSVSFSPDGTLLASGGDNHVEIWDARTGSSAMTLRGHEGKVHSVSFSPDGESLASGSEDNTIRVWDVSTGETMMVLRGHEGAVTSIVFAPDGRRLVSGSWDGTVKIWDVDATRELIKLVGHSSWADSVAFSPDGRRIVSAGAYDGIKIWDVQSATEMLTLGRADGICVAFGPDGNRIASRDTSSGTFTIWDAVTGDRIMTFPAPLGRPLSRLGIKVAFSPDGTHLASSGGVDRTVKVWNSTTGEQVMALKGHDSIVSCVRFSPDGKSIVSGAGDPNIKVWEWKTGREVMTLRGHNEGIITSVAFSPDGKRIVSGSQQDGTARVWDATTGTELLTLKHADGVTSAVFSPDGKRIISGSHDRTVRVWDAITGAELLMLRAGSVVDAVTFSPDGKTIAGGPSDHTVTLWESVAPAGGYGRRKHGEAARRAVDKLHEEHGSYREVIGQLQHSATIDPAVGRLALQIANSRKWEDVDKLRKEVWAAVSLADKDTYQEALATAEKANVWEPNDPAVLCTLGAAQYRTGSYEEALKTLTRAERLRADTGEEQDPAGLAFTTMSLHHLGQAGKATSTLEQLRALLEDERFADDGEAKALLAEAEGLIMGTRE